MLPSLFSASVVRSDIRTVGNGGAAAVPILIAEGVRRRFFRAEDCRYSRGSNCAAGGLFDGERLRLLSKGADFGSAEPRFVKDGCTVWNDCRFGAGSDGAVFGRYLKIFIFIASYPAMSYFCMFGGEERDSTRNYCFGRKFRDMHREERTGRPDRGMIIRLY